MNTIDSCFNKPFPPCEDSFLPFTDFASFPITGETSELYLDQSSNTLYLWNGTSYEPLGGNVNSSTQITGTNSVTGGGDLSVDRQLELVNDEAAPGNVKYYGTDNTGTKGYHDLPCPLVSESSSANDSYVATGAYELKDCLLIPFISQSGNTGAATLDYNGTGARPIVNSTGSALSDDQIQDGRLTFVKYDAANNRYELMQLNDPVLPCPMSVDVIYNITNGNVVRTFDANTTTIHELADVVHTLYIDLVNAQLFGTGTPTSILENWTITNLTFDRSIDANLVTIHQLADFIGTVIEDLKTTNLMNGGILDCTEQSYLAVNDTTLRTLDTDATTVNELADVFVTMFRDILITGIIQ